MFTLQGIPFDHPLPEGTVKDVAVLPLENRIKLLVYLNSPFCAAGLIVNGERFEDAFNDKEPYDFETHIFYIPADKLLNGAALIFTASDSLTDGETYACELCYEPKSFFDENTLKNEYDNRLTPQNTQKTELENGVTYTHTLYADQNNAPVHAFLLTLDPKKATLFIGTPHNGYQAENTVSTVPDMIKDAMNAGQDVIAAVNADFFDMFGNGAPSGLCVKNGKIVANADSLRPFVGIKKDMTPVISSLKESPELINDLYQAASGLQLIVKNGKLHEFGPLEPFCYVRHPRTAAGIKEDGTLLFLVVDGRIPDYSNGASLVDLAKLMISFGAVTAINMDGGGSSVVYLNQNGELKLQNRPADLVQPDAMLIREEFNCLMLVKRSDNKCN